MPRSAHRLPQVQPAEITLAGEPGYNLCREIAHASACGTPIEAEGLAYRQDGSLELRVSPETIDLLSGKAELKD